MSRVMPTGRGGQSPTDREMAEANRVRFVEGESDTDRELRQAEQARFHEGGDQPQASDNSGQRAVPNSVKRYQEQSGGNEPVGKVTPKSAERIHQQEQPKEAPPPPAKRIFHSSGPMGPTSEPVDSTMPAHGSPYPFPKDRPVAVEEFATGGDQVTAGDEPRGVEFRSMPQLSQAAFKIARRMRGVPDDLADEQALAQGIISPELLQLVMTIVMDLFQNCLDNSPTAAFRTVRRYVEGTREMDKLGDTIRLNWMVDRWFNRLGVPRDRGDVVAARKAIVEAVEGLSQQDFVSVQTEVLFLTV